jgi:D-alanyl-lipoteichoic acid acyltransferase DltB (MBOAT superfamily)
VPPAVLFNTALYAQFFAIVFVISWLLVSRRWALVLPWCALAGYVLARPTAPGVFAAALALAVTALFWYRASRTHGPGPVPTTAALLVNVAPLAWLSYEHSGLDPLSLALRALGVPIPALTAVGAGALLSTLLLSYLVLRAQKLRLLFILGASYVFYAHWDYRFLPLIWGSSTADWLLGNAIAHAPTRARRKLWLIATVVMNLSVLALFKYFDFGVESARAALHALGFHPPEVALRLALPVGISFFTFESMSYVIDIYRGDIEPHPSYLEYLGFVAFFPHLVAGPIVRPRDLLPQLAGKPRWHSGEGAEALFLIASGLLKKIAIGDYLALNLVDRVFGAPLSYSALECYAAALGYAVQIYCDFSGYTDIAIGSALLLGVRFPKNFDAPYKSRDIVEFWRRWHISLSTWLRDYLYIPLGGNRKGPLRTYVNLMITMLLGGLWHGANWTFVAWGGLHGLALAVTRAYQARRAPRPSAPPRLVTRAVATLLTFHFVTAAWIFFRAESFSHAGLMFTQLGTGTTFHPNLHPGVLAVLALGLFSHWAPESWYLRAQQGFTALPAPAQGLVLFCVALALREMASAQAVPFVYFQF